MSASIAEWKRFPIGTIARPRLGGNYKNSPSVTGRPLIKMGNIARVKIDLSRLEYIPDSERVDEVHRLVNGDVLFNTRNTLELVGKVSIWRDELPVAYYNSNILRLEFKPEVCGDSQYFGYALNSAENIKAIRNLATGTTSVAAVYTRDLLKLEVWVPSKEEQRAIADALNDVDQLIAALERMIAKQRAITEGLMQQLLTGRSRLDGFNLEWQERKLETLLAPRVERHMGSDSLEVLSCTKHRGFVRSLDYFKNQVFSRDLTGYRVIRRGDIGYPANHVEEGSIGVQELFDAALVSPIYVVLRPVGDVNTHFLQRQLKLDYFRQQFARVTNASVNRRGSLRWPQFSQLEVLVPGRPEQDAISNVLRDTSIIEEALQRQLAKAQRVKRGVMQELLSGRTRLPVVEVAA